MKNIASVKIAKLPVGWAAADSATDFGNISTPKGFEVIQNDLFYEAVNANPGLTGKPRIGTIVDNRLIVYPVPTSEEDGDRLELIVYLKSSSITIDKDTEPELPEAFDKLLELFATSQFLSGKDRFQWLSEYNSELRRLKPIEHRKQHPIERKSIPGLL